MSASPRTSTRAKSNPRNDIITMLKDDHKRAKKAFRDFAKLDAQEDTAECLALVTQTCGELKVHATLEEELIYPAARSVLSDEDLIDEAEVEHATFKSLIQQLESMSPQDDKFAATFTVLGEYIEHHVGEEEGEMFPMLAKAELDWPALNKEIVARRQELMEEFLPEAANDASSASKSRRPSETASRRSA